MRKIREVESGEGQQDEKLNAVVAVLDTFEILTRPYAIAAIYTEEQCGDALSILVEPESVSDSSDPSLRDGRFLLEDYVGGKEDQVGLLRAYISSYNAWRNGIVESLDYDFNTPAEMVNAMIGLSADTAYLLCGADYPEDFVRGHAQQLQELE